MKVSGVIPAGSASGRWSLTRADIVLCMVPVALFLSIVSLV